MRRRDGCSKRPQLVSYRAYPKLEMICDCATHLILSAFAVPGPSVDVHTFRPSMIVRLVRDSTPVTWRAVSKDGMDLPADRATVRRAVQQMGNGETYDFELAPTEPADLTLVVTSAVGVRLAEMPVVVP